MMDVTTGFVHLCFVSFLYLALLGLSPDCPEEWRRAIARFAIRFDNYVSHYRLTTSI